MRHIFISVALLLGGSTAQATRLPVFPNEVYPVQLQNVQNGKCLEIRGAAGDGADAVQQTCGPQDHQSWSLIWTGGDDYQLRPHHRGNVRLGIAGESTGNGAAVRLVNGDRASQNFQFIAQGDGSFGIVNKRSGNCIQIPLTTNADGATLTQEACHTGLQQRWRIVPRVRAMHLVTKTTTKCVEITNQHTIAGASLGAADCVGAAWHHQEWLVETVPFAKDYVQLRSPHSGHCLSIRATWEAWQQPCNGKPDQMWRISTPDADGYAMLTNRDSLCLDAGSKVLGGYYCDFAKPSQRFAIRRQVKRSVMVIEPATSDGLDRHVANPADIQIAVARANAVYKQHGVELTYSPTFDTVQYDSDALHRVGEDAVANQVFRCDDPFEFKKPRECAQEVAAMYPDRVVIMIGPGNAAGFSSGESSYVFLRPGLGNNCNTGVPAPIFPHELGHYLGLSHVFVEYKDASLAGAAYATNGAAAFEGDLLQDTTPDPVLNQNCLAPTSPTGWQLLFLPFTGGPIFITQLWLLVQTDNAMSYYFNVAPKITPQQAAIVRATAFARDL